MNPKYFLCAILICAIIGCTHSAKDPVQGTLSGQPDGTNIARESPGNRYIFGIWNVRILPHEGIAEIVPVRYAGVHMNVLRFLETEPCDNCVAIDEITMPSPNELRAMVELTHTFAPTKYYCAFDVRGICMLEGNYSFPGSGRTAAFGDDIVHMLNADGYTSLYNPTEFPPNSDVPCLGYIDGQYAEPGLFNSTLNPFIAFAPDWNRWLFGAAQANVARDIHLHVPVGTDPIEFGYAVDVSREYVDYVEIPWYDYPPEATGLEAYEIKANFEEKVHPAIGSETDFTVDVFDHQGRDTRVGLGEQL